MGGGKKPTTTNKDKSSNPGKKSKKDKVEGGTRKAEIIVQVDEKQAMKIIQNSKVITVQDMARQQELKFLLQMHF